MGFKRCPGSSAFSQPKIELVPCTQCGADVEVWSDEPDGKCLACGCSVTRTSTQSCLDWCKYASDCLGDEKYKKYLDTKSALRKDALLRAAADRFGQDGIRRQQSELQLRHAEAVLKGEPQADPNIVMAAAVLSAAEDNALGDPSVSTTASEEATRVARSLLMDLDYPDGFVEQVCRIISGASAASEQDVNARVVREALRRAREDGS